MSKLCGALYRQYPKSDFRTLLRFLASQLSHNHQTVDLCVLQQMVEVMGGVVDDTRLSEEQLECAAAGAVLRKMCEERGQTDSSKKRVSRTASDYLRRALTASKLGIPLVVLVAQERNTMIYRAKTKSVRFIHNMADLATVSAAI